MVVWLNKHNVIWYKHKINVKYYHKIKNVDGM